MDGQEQRRLASLMEALAALLVLMAMQYVCRFRNRHEPDEGVVDAFLSSGDEKLMTKCGTCECDLALWADTEDGDLYWIVEV